MNLEEARAIQQEYRRDSIIHDLWKFQQSIDVSIEAMSYIYLCRVAEPGSVPELLNGETIH